MNFILVSSTLLCVIAWMNSIQGIHGMVHDCKCPKPTDTKVHKTKIVSYTIQEESICNVRVVMFLTVKGKTICADPNSSWTKEVMRTLDEKKPVMEAQKKGAESTKTPSRYTMTPAATRSTVFTSTSSVFTSTSSVSTSTPSGSASTHPGSAPTHSGSTVAPTETTTAASTLASSTLKPTAAPSSNQASVRRQRGKGNGKHGNRGRRGRNGRKNKRTMKKWQKKEARKELQIILRYK
ncbi:Lymphotactin [Oryzias melastigma]|uniref:Location of vulva defective 1-like n=1 Tax=Oryzias melastigma TaxID=30732 RepID=A0A3B3DVM5_ORYME|nr:location of vulva defective 1 [Oryzias melastigma]KAF6727609.1 Lymphotactin [Oryzias melastigma]